MTQPPPEPEMTEAQMRQLEAELERVHVDDVVLQTIVSLINLGARKGAVGAPPEAGIVPDNEQLGIAIDAAVALLAVVEPRHADKIGPIRDAVSQLQLAYARQGGAAPAPGGPRPAAPPPPSPPQGGRLWIPGQ